MKKLDNSYLVLIFCFFLTAGLSAQKGLHIGKLKIQKFDFSSGYETDYINDMDYTFFTEALPSDQQTSLAQLNFRPSSFYSGVCENPSINFGLTLVHPRLSNFEWRNAIAIKPNRVDAISYYNDSPYDGEYMNIYSTHAEYAFETALIYKLSLSNFFNLYGGAGTNLGISSNNETCIFSSSDLTADDINFRNIDEVSTQVPAGAYGSGDGYQACYDTGAQINQRIFVQVGAGLIFFKRIEIGLDVKYGVGYRADLQAGAHGTNITSTNLSIRYILK